MSGEAYAALPRGRHLLSREYVDRYQRERMVRAVAELAHEEGLAGVTVTRVTARARISRKTFYDYFGDIEECVDHAGERAMAHLFEPAEEARTAGSPSGETTATTARLEGLLEAVASEPLLAELALIHVPALGSKRGRWFQEIAVGAVAGLVSGGDDERAAMAETSASAIIGVIAFRVGHGEAARIDEMRQTVVGLGAAIDAASPGA
jgi:AcrR family transcriptional regulator